ncbi:MAG: peptidyl-prolyl cis-trans isomerase [Alphaproteobacteria bacterium]|nr:peptidyl-prolyl cis-trans isomerase [Alphaproteobacteria bacterium]
MLRAMRSGKQSVIIKSFFLGLLALAAGGLVLTDVQGVFNRGLPKATIATIDGEKLTSLEFDRMVQSAITQQRMSQSDAYRSGLPERMLEQEINARIFSRAARDAGLIVDNRSAAQYVRSAFLEPLVAQGVHEEDALQYLLRSAGLSEAGLLASVRSQIASENLLKVLAVGAYAPARLVDDALKFRYEARRAEYFTLTLKEIGTVAEPTEEELQQHYKTTMSRYMLPEYRTLTALLLDGPALGINPVVSEDDIRAYFDEHKRDYSTAEEREIEQLVVDDEDTAKQIRAAAVAAGKNLKKGVEAVKSASAGVVSGTYSEDDIAEPLADAAFKTPAGDISEPVKSSFGWHLVRVVKVTKPGTAQKFEDVRAEIAKRLAAEKGADALYEVINAIDDTIAGGQVTLAQLAEEYKLKPVSFESIDVSGFTAAGRKADLSGLPVADKAIEAGFGLPQGGVSALIETPEGGFVVVSPAEIKAAEARPFANVRREVTLSWKTMRKNALLDEKAAQVMERINMGEGFDVVAKSFGKTLARSELLRRDSDAAKVPLGRGMIPALFSIEKSGQATTVRADDSLSFMRMAERRTELPKDSAEGEVKMLQQALSRSLQGDLIEQYRLGLMSKYNVKINQRAIENIYNPDKAE